MISNSEPDNDNSSNENEAEENQVEDEPTLDDILKNAESQTEAPDDSSKEYYVYTNLNCPLEEDFTFIVTTLWHWYKVNPHPTLKIIKDPAEITVEPPALTEEEKKAEQEKKSKEEEEEKKKKASGGEDSKKDEPAGEKKGEENKAEAAAKD